jgi:hypothetical protein
MFKEISEISFNSQSFNFSLLTEILKDFKQNKLTKLSFSNTGQQISFEFLKTLFSVTNLIEFEVRSLCKEEEFKLVSSWIETRVFNKRTCSNCLSCLLNNEQTNERTVQRTNERTNEPIKLKIYFFEFVEG